jgi:phosphate uptake regulator
MKTTRSIQSTGGSSLIVTLPKQWTAKNKLQAKDKIEVIEGDNYVMMKPFGTGADYKNWRLRINAEQLTPRELGWELEACYTCGIEEADITNRSGLLNQMKVIREVINKLPGFEIVETSRDRTVIKNIYDQTRLPINQATYKLLDMVIIILGELVECLEEGDISRARDLIDRDDEVDKMFRIILRQSSQTLRQENSTIQKPFEIETAHYFRGIAASLEKIADHAVNLSRYMLQENRIQDWINDTAPMSLLKDLANNMVREMKMILTTDKRIAYEVMEHCKLLEKRVQTLGLSRYRNKPHFSLVMASLGRMGSYFRSIAELTVDHIMWLEVSGGKKIAGRV